MGVFHFCYGPEHLLLWLELCPELPLCQPEPARELFSNHLRIGELFARPSIYNLSLWNKLNDGANDTAKHVTLNHMTLFPLAQKSTRSLSLVENDFL
jgi:hypothetical protein